MPKMKSVKGAVKRFKVKKNGTIKRGSAFRSHILTKKTQKRKRAEIQRKRKAARNQEIRRNLYRAERQVL